MHSHFDPPSFLQFIWSRLEIYFFTTFSTYWFPYGIQIIHVHGESLFAFSFLVTESLEMFSLDNVLSTVVVTFRSLLSRGQYFYRIQLKCCFVVPRTWLCGQMSSSMYRKLGVIIIELYQERGSRTGASSVIHFLDWRQFLIFLWLFLVFLFLSHLRYLRTLVRILFHAHARAHIISCARSCAYHFISMTPRIQHNFTRPWWLASRRIRHIGTEKSVNCMHAYTSMLLE